MEPPQRSSRLGRLRGARLDVALASTITLAAGLVRFIRLQFPRKIIPLDETYYAVNSLGFLKHGTDQQFSSTQVLEPAFAVHPPAGKWVIAGGIKAFGYNSFGWRAGAALVGTLSVLVLYMLARRLWRSPWIAATAASLLALDGLHFVQSRIAMLDIFLAFFILLAVWMLVEDRERTSPAYRGVRWWRLASGAAIGLALATKWSAAFVLPMLFVVALVWELDRMARRRVLLAGSVVKTVTESADPVSSAWSDDPHQPGPQPDNVDDTPTPEMRDEVGAEPPGQGLEPGPPPIPYVSGAPRITRSTIRTFEGSNTVLRVLWAAGTFVLLPLVVYVLTYVPWFAAKPVEQGGHRYTAPRCVDPAFTGIASPVNSRVWNWDGWPANWRSWVCYQREIFDYHKNLKNFDAKGKPIHPYLTRAWSWPWIGRPTAHDFDSSPPKSANPNQAEILGLPNTTLWFAAFFIALPLCAFWAIARRDQTAALLLLLFAPLYVPWLVTSRPLFMFYMTPAVPFLVLLVCHVIHRALDSWSVDWQRLLAAAMLVLPFTPLVIQWFSVSGFTFQLGTNATVAHQSWYVLAGKAAVILGIVGLAWLAVTGLYLGRRPNKLLASYVGFTLVMFLYFYPVLAAVHIPDTGKDKAGISHVVWQSYGWRSHMWLTADCRSSGIKIGCWI